MFMSKTIASSILGCFAAMIVVWLALPHPAHACSVHLIADRPAVMPADGTKAVPTNTQIRLHYFPVFSPETQEVLRAPVVRPVGGVPIAIDTEVIVEIGSPIFDPRLWSPWQETWIVVRPTQPLAPNTTYEILDRFESSCERHPCIRESYAVVATFTTGGGPDEHPPDLGDLTEVATTRHPPTGGPACGSAFPYLSAKLQWPPADDNSGTEQVRYNVYQDDELIRGFLAETTYEEPMGVCPASPKQQQIVRYRIEALDLAGNESTIERVLTVQCPDEDMLP